MRSTAFSSPSAGDTQLFWDEAQRRSFSAVRCASCGTISHPPTASCTVCGQGPMVASPVGGSGTLYASTVVEHQTDPNWPVPFTIVLVDVDGVTGLRLAGSLSGRWALRPGEPMELWFEARTDDVVVPQWRPVGVQGNPERARAGYVVSGPSSSMTIPSGS